MTARAGETLHVDQQGRYVRRTVPVFGPEWAWASTIAPQFQLEGSTVQQFLEWVAREQGGAGGSSMPTRQREPPES